jgi:S-adenosylmethionine synthetase
MDLTLTKGALAAHGIEIVERKGRGHPDTLTDGLAEELSVRYALHTRERFGTVLHHNFDKVGLLGGASDAQLGNGTMLSPIRVLLNGRASSSFGGEQLPLQDLLREWAVEFLTRELPRLDPARHLTFHDNVSSANTAGYPSNDFAPTDSGDLYQAHQALSSDTAAICVQYPPTPIEETVYAVERLLTSDEHRATRPWLGSDIKVLACGSAEAVTVTACVPQIADEVHTIEQYAANIDAVRADVLTVIREHLPEAEVSLTLNTLDDFERGSLYLTVLGSCIESGDEGMVGRGNRPSGVIPVLGAFSGEAACGKNPVFFPGKVYTAAGKEIARKLHEATGARVDVWLLSQEGRPLSDPWRVVVRHDGTGVPEPQARTIIEEVLADTSHLTEAILRREVRLC